LSLLHALAVDTDSVLSQTGNGKKASLGQGCCLCFIVPTTSWCLNVFRFHGILSIEIKLIARLLHFALNLSASSSCGGNEVLNFDVLSG